MTKVLGYCANCGEEKHISSVKEYELYKCPRCHSKTDFDIYTIDILQQVFEDHPDIIDYKTTRT